jgi:SAM-dependent methyltransferase
MALTIRNQCPLCSGTRLTRHLKATDPSKGRIAKGQMASIYRCTTSGYGRHPEILRCLTCRLAFLKETPTAEDLLKLYSDVEDPLYEKEEAARWMTFDAHLAGVESIIGPAGGRSLLDVGAYTGVAVEVACKRGWQAIGVEPSRWAVESGQRRGRRLVLGPLTRQALNPLGPFDVATLWDVIEHVADPVAVLTTVHKQLKPGGYVVVHTMDVDSMFARLAGRRWPWYMDMHLFYFSPSTLSRLLRTAGFSPIHIGRRGRMVSLGYLGSRITALVPLLGRPLERLVSATGLASRPVRVGFGDLFTVVARCS